MTLLCFLIDMIITNNTANHNMKKTNSIPIRRLIPYLFSKE